MATARSLQFDIGWDVNRRGLERANESTDRLKSKTQRTGEFLQRNKETMLGFTAAAATGLGFAVREAAQFEEQMAKVENVSGANEEQLASLTEQAKQLGVETAFSAQQAAEGQEFLARAGFQTREVMETLPGVLDLAAASELQLGQAADISSNVLQGFQLEAEETGRVVDTMAAASANANTNVQQVGSAMSMAAPVASNLGFSIEETTAAIGQMADAGIQGSRAGRTLRAGLSRLVDPSNDAKETLRELGVEMENGQFQFDSMQDAISQLQTGLQGMEKNQRQAALSTIFGRNAVSGFSAIINRGSEDLGAFTNQLQNSGGTAESMAENQLDTLTGSLKQLRGSTSTAAIEIGGALAPAVRTVTDGLVGALNVFNEMPDSVQATIGVSLGLGTAILGIATAVGFLIGPITTFVGILPTLGTLIGGVTAAFGAFNAVLLANPIGAIIGFIGLLTTAIITFKDKWGSIAEGIGDFIGYLGGLSLSDILPQGLIDFFSGPETETTIRDERGANRSRIQAQRNDRKTVNRTSRNIRQNQTVNRQENNVEIRVEGGNNDEETARRVRREVYKVMDEGAAAAGAN